MWIFNSWRRCYTPRRVIAAMIAVATVTGGCLLFRTGHDERFVGKWTASREGLQPSPFVIEFDQFGAARIPANGARSQYAWWVSGDNLVMQESTGRFLDDTWTRVHYAYAKAAVSLLPQSVREFPIKRVQADRIVTEIVTPHMEQPGVIVGRQGLILERVTTDDTRLPGLQATQ